jgi:hypothetical protein
VGTGDYETLDHLIWHSERFRLERHRLIDALAALYVSIGIHIRDLCEVLLELPWKVWDKALMIQLFFCI